MAGAIVDSMVEIAGAVGGLTTIFGGWKLGAWLLDMRRAKLEATQKDNDAKRLALIEDRQGDEGRNTELIQRMQSMIDDLKAEIAALKRESAANLRACEDREERLQERVGKLEVFKGRATERIRVLENMSRRVKGFNLPDFAEDPTDPPSSTHSVLA